MKRNRVSKKPQNSTENEKKLVASPNCLSAGHYLPGVQTDVSIGRELTSVSTQTHVQGEKHLNKAVSTQTDTQEDRMDTPSNTAMLKTAIKLLSELNVKIDTMGAMSLQKQKNEMNVELPTLRNIPFSPVKSVIELQDIERKASDEKFVAEVVSGIGRIHGRGRFTSDGGTVCLQIIDYFFERQFLTTCSWTGTGKNKEKVPFLRFERIIHLFFQTVLFADPQFTLDQAKDFLHRCLRNANQRCKELGARKSVARKRNRRVPLTTRNDKDEETDTENVDPQEMDDYKVEYLAEEEEN